MLGSIEEESSASSMGMMPNMLDLMMLKMLDPLGKSLLLSYWG